MNNEQRRELSDWFIVIHSDMSSVRSIIEATDHNEARADGMIKLASLEFTVYDSLRTLRRIFDIPYDRDELEGKE